MKNKDSKNPEDWFKKANDDLSFAKAGFRETKISSIACFLSQQIVEKYLKGFLLSKNISFKKTHNLLNLLDKCVLFNEEFGKFYAACRKLNKYYNPVRYPDEIFIDYTEEDAEEALELAEKIIKFIKRLVS